MGTELLLGVALPMGAELLLGTALPLGAELLLGIALPPLSVVAAGALAGIGLLGIGFSGPLSRKWARAAEKPGSERGRVERVGAERAEAGRRFGAVAVTQASGAAAGAVVGWWATELLGMALLLGGLGALLPAFMAAPRRRRRQMRVALAWALWSRQIAELVRSGSGLVDSLTGSVEHAPGELAPVIEKVADAAELHGFEAAMDELAASGDVWEPEIAAGLRMASTVGGATADPLFDLCERIGDTVDLHRAKNEGVVQLWAQTVALLVLATGIVSLMYANNPDYFAPYSTGTGQMVFVLISLLLLGSTAFLVYHSTVREDSSILVSPKRRSRAKEPI